MYIDVFTFTQGLCILLKLSSITPLPTTLGEIYPKLRGLISVFGSLPVLLSLSYTMGCTLSYSNCGFGEPHSLTTLISVENCFSVSFGKLETRGRQGKDSWKEGELSYPFHLTGSNVNVTGLKLRNKMVIHITVFLRKERDPETKNRRITLVITEGGVHR